MNKNLELFLGFLVFVVALFIMGPLLVVFFSAVLLSWKECLQSFLDVWNSL